MSCSTHPEKQYNSYFSMNKNKNSEGPVTCDSRQTKVPFPPPLPTWTVPILSRTVKQQHEKNIHGLNERKIVQTFINGVPFAKESSPCKKERRNGKFDEFIFISTDFRLFFLSLFLPLIETNLSFTSSKSSDCVWKPVCVRHGQANLES
jgi:hypothetical protein